MLTRRSLRLPITLAIVMISLLVVLTVGWVLLNVFWALKSEQFAPLYWTLLSLGSTFIAMLLAGVVIYLIFSITTINLNRRQSNFIDSVTHELKSPIASMKLYLQTLHRRQVSQEEQASFYRFMLEDLDRLDHLINQLLDAGLLDSGRTDGEVEDVPLGTLLQDCARSVCLRYRVPLETVQFDVQPCAVRARRVDLDIIFRNLIDNAVKYAGPAAARRGKVAADGRRPRGDPDRRQRAWHPLITCAAGFSAASSGWGWNWSARSPAPGWDCTWSATSSVGSAAASASATRRKGRARSSRCSCPAWPSTTRPAASEE